MVLLSQAIALNYSATSQNSAEPRCFSEDVRCLLSNSLFLYLSLFCVHVSLHVHACTWMCVCSCMCSQVCEWMCRHKHGDQRSKLVVFSIAFHGVSHWLQSHGLFNLSFWARSWDPPVSTSTVLRLSVQASVATNSLYGCQGSELESSCLQAIYWLRYLSSLPHPNQTNKQGRKEGRREGKQNLFNIQEKPSHFLKNHYCF